MTSALSEGRKNNVRIGSIKDDVVAGICDIPNDPVHFYIVGATKGDMGGIKASGEHIVENSLLKPSSLVRLLILPIVEIMQIPQLLQRKMTRCVGGKYSVIRHVTRREPIRND